MFSFDEKIKVIAGKKRGALQRLLQVPQHARNAETIQRHSQGLANVPSLGN